MCNFLGQPKSEEQNIILNNRNFDGIFIVRLSFNKVHIKVLKCKFFPYHLFSLHDSFSCTFNKNGEVIRA